MGEPDPPEATRLTPAQIAGLRRDLLDWYASEKRDLPWRRTRDPYAIWISEAMLQQTRVETVIPYWTRFLERFPDCASLAAAPEDELLAAWSGLGYYRRARALKRAAEVLAAEHGGRFPRDRDAALALPGVGPYTAGAVLSIAYDRPEPLVDGNVVRVFSRLFDLDAPVGSAASNRELWRLAERLVPRRPHPERGPGAWNQAVMELGATVCRARAPQCLLCPVRRRCRALRAGRAEELPRSERRERAIDVELEILLVVRGDRLLLARRDEGGRMAGLWECPTREIGSDLLWSAAAPGGLEPLRGGDEPLGTLRHGITRHRISAAVREGAPPAGRVRLPLRWWPVRDLGDAALTGMTRKLLRSSFARAAIRRGGSGVEKSDLRPAPHRAG